MRRLLAAIAAAIARWLEVQCYRYGLRDSFQGSRGFPDEEEWHVFGTKSYEEFNEAFEQ